jgi:riboflavin kinase/FMN adenylyltransferase
VAIGNFDGVHLGHAKIVERLVQRARQLAGPAVVLTFDPHPVRILRPEQSPPPLTWTDRKAQLLSRLRVDWMVVCPTDEQFLRLSPEEFFATVVKHTLDARGLVEGPNFFFGHDRRGDIDRLDRLAREAGIELDVVPAVVIDGDRVSSSRIRRSLVGGNVAAACRMLTEPYRIRGMVTHGMARGARLGFPTANLEAIDTLVPADGVYAGRAWLADRPFKAAVHVGPVPTFGQNARRVEVHLIGFQGSIYGEPLEVDFLERLRDIRSFPSADALREQLATDVRRAEKQVPDS